jgi:cell division protein FtsB
VARTWEWLRQSWLAMALFALATALLASAAWSERGLSRVWQLRTEVEEAKDRNFRLVQQISTLRRDLEMARSDDATLEHLARRYLGMVRPGEVLYRVPAAAGGGADEDAAALDDEATVAPSNGAD